jgi:hypothetical protein
MKAKTMPESYSTTEPNQSQCHSELFTVRLWREQLNDHWEWRGKVQHVLSGETRYFRDWQTLLAFIQETWTEAGINGREHPSLDTLI